MRSLGPRTFLLLVWVLTYVTPALAQDVSPNENVPIPGWVWVVVGSAGVLVAFGVALGLTKGDVDKHEETIKKLVTDFETYKKEVTASFDDHAKEDRSTYALKSDVEALAVAKASKEYVDGILNGITAKFDLVLGRVESMKNDMDRQFMFLREELRGNSTGLPSRIPNEDTNPGGGNTPTGRRRP